MENIVGIIFPLPKDAIDFMFNNKRDVYVKYLSREPKDKMKTRIKEDNILYLYQSGGSKSIVGEATIETVDFLDKNDILNKYSGRLMIPDEIFDLYSKGRENKKALVLQLGNLKKYKKEINISEPVTMAGLYLTAEKRNSILGGK